MMLPDTRFSEFGDVHHVFLIPVRCDRDGCPGSSNKAVEYCRISLAQDPLFWISTNNQAGLLLLQKRISRMDLWLNPFRKRICPAMFPPKTAGRMPHRHDGCPGSE